ncbi:DUF1080 domain-containing protein [Aliifodinibius sp. S!AR15-10]|uniref:3-keto-disaccharide hydrolase n=1 Tax=Aliifodinibius sp. S!AR15-10 TaxID=2950437 RepID=UPI0028555152|nr:DUF1080 domain-containing protein [Aliifodinibius sp. S!AR15-10]MDR8394323.1 DUF1080 domain-containing protein [Aliifodinibius sp. S!AR15-10]
MRNKLENFILIVCTLGLLASGFSSALAQQSGEDWISLFDGKTLEGWKASENPETFSVEEDKIVAHGPRAHLFYQGPVSNHDFKNFEFRADIMTTKGSNSGIYFHTAYQETGWPSNGYEAQVNNTYESDPRKTASLYGYDDINKAPVPDNEWFTMYIKVQGKRVTIKVNGKTMVEYTEPENVDREGAVLSSGTFALQGHDPESRVYYKNIMVKPL